MFSYSTPAGSGNTISCINVQILMLSLYLLRVDTHYIRVKLYLLLVTTDCYCHAS